MTESARRDESARRPEARLRSEMAWSTPDRIVVRGLDLTQDLMGRVNLGDMAFFELMGRLPTPSESIVFNASLVALVEHGITPNALATRLTYLGAPEALQGAVAAGLLGLGSVFVGTIEGAARLLQEAIQPDDSQPDLEALARDIVRSHRERKQHIPGLGHPIHKPVDPRTVRLFELAEEQGLAGRYVRLMRLIGDEAERQSGRELPVNVTGAIGAVASELGIPWQVCRGLGVMARPIGLVAHLLEETRSPMAAEIWRRVDEEASVGPSEEKERSNE
jgi:citrate synthase